MHALFGHILLCEHLCELFGAVVTEVHEDHYVALTDASVDGAVADRLDKLVGYALVVALLHSLYHVGSLFAFVVNQQVVSLFHAVPAFVAVHGVEASYDVCYVCVVLFAALLHLLDEALTALGVGVATVHEAVYEELVFQSILFTYLDKLEQVAE